MQRLYDAVPLCWPVSSRSIAGSAQSDIYCCNVQAPSSIDRRNGDPTKAGNMSLSRKDTSDDPSSVPNGSSCAQFLLIEVNVFRHYSRRIVSTPMWPRSCLLLWRCFDEPLHSIPVVLAQHSKSAHGNRSVELVVCPICHERVLSRGWAISALR